MFWKRCFSLVLLSLLYGCSTLRVSSVENLELASPGVAVRFLYESQGGRAEAYLIRPRGIGPSPLIVLLHGHNWRGEGAIRVVPAAEQLSSELCYASLAISLPGYGMTEIPGGNNQQTIMRVILDGISRVHELPWVDRENVMVYGFSRGAVFAAAMAGKILGLRGVILHSGAYDIDRLYQETPSQWVRRSINPNGEPNPRLFSVLPEVSSWTAPTLILHGEKDEVVPANQATLLRDRLRELGKPHRLVSFPEAGHRLPSGEVKKQVVSFLSQNVGSACPR